MLRIIKHYLYKLLNIQENYARISVRTDYKQIMRAYNDNRPETNNINKEWVKLWKSQ